MNFKPQTEQEINDANNIPNGDWPFEVLNAIDTKSQAGNDMIKLTLRVFVHDTPRQIDDYLLESMPGKLFHFCSYTGLATQYQNGTLRADDCLGKSGFLTIGTSKGKPKKDVPGEFWPDRANVKDYIRNISGVKKDVIAGAKATEDHIDGDPY